MKISVIIVTYNSAQGLQKSLNSLSKQDYRSIEAVIIDGGSTDGSLDVIRDFERRFHGEVKWISERDHGIYDGLNKGLRMATGEIIGCFWDLYAADNVLSKIVQTIETEKTDGVHGDLIYLDGDKPVRHWKTGNGRIRDGWMPAHPTLYLKRNIYEKYGQYKTDYRCSADFEFMVRALSDETVKLSYIPEVLIYMFYGGVSTNGLNAYMRSIRESIRALRENGYRFPLWIILKRALLTVKQFTKRR